ncbi:MAG: hypothetical protein FWE24_04335 [Defluviitaleaceae bacterium]|nr:hypothetical protein [Defluviitaleaceae bacterium]
MDKHRRVFKKSLFASIVSIVIPIIFTLIIIGMILIGLRQAEQSGRAESLRLLEEALLRAVVHNYAITGRFPESLSYISDKYGIYIDTSRFVVHYEVFAENILPDIIIFELN